MVTPPGAWSSCAERGVEPGIDGLQLVGSGPRLSFGRHALRPQVVGHPEQERPVLRVGNLVAESIEDDASLGRGAVVAVQAVLSSSGATSLE